MVHIFSLWRDFEQTFMNLIKICYNYSKWHGEGSTHLVTTPSKIWSILRQRGGIIRNDNFIVIKIFFWIMNKSVYLLNANLTCWNKVLNMNYLSTYYHRWRHGWGLPPGGSEISSEPSVASDAEEVSNLPRKAGFASKFDAH